MRETTIKEIVEKYQDFIDIYSDFDNVKKLLGNRPDSFNSIFEKNLTALLTYQTPNKFTITYHDVELAHHSLGQRASALILFVMGQGENDVIIIDQPEDDLDNQTIYEDVIKLIQELKPSVQSIFATHNPNIPVLGDAERVFVLESDGASGRKANEGTVDECKADIVTLLEGGQEAFEQRQQRYAQQ